MQMSPEERQSLRPSFDARIVSICDQRASILSDAGEQLTMIFDSEKYPEEIKKDLRPGQGIFLFVRGCEGKEYICTLLVKYSGEEGGEDMSIAGPCRILPNPKGSDQ